VLVPSELLNFRRDKLVGRCLGGGMIDMRAACLGVWLGLGLWGVGVVTGENESGADLGKYREASEKKWEEAIVEMEGRDAVEKHGEDAILFVGSSSIRRWDTIGEDMAPYGVIQRGFGGSKWSDVAVYADRLITPHAFRAVVFFVGNDVAGKEGDKTPEEVAALFRYVLRKVRAHAPEAAVFYIAVTPTGKRWAVWPKIREANAAAQAVCKEEENAWFIETEGVYLDAEGEPRAELFVEDQLHLNEDGYALWAAAIKSRLDAVLGGAGG
jgi:hypothetical protein